MTKLRYAGKLNAKTVNKIIYFMKKLTALFLLLLICIVYAVSVNGCKEGSVETPITPPPVFNPTKILSKTLGSNLNDQVTAVRQADDGGILICGYTIASAFGDNDIFIAKMDNTGNVMWCNLYGGSGNDQALSMERTSDGFVVAGATNSFSGTFDPFVVKMDNSGNIQWSKYYRWFADDYANNITPTSDGGYILTGYSNSFGAGENDIYSLKLDASGGIMWCRCYGGAFNEFGNSIKQNGDGGYTIGGYTFSFGQFGDGLVLKLFGDGALMWAKNYGGGGLDNIKDLQNASNGLIACGSTFSFGLVNEDALVFNLDNSGFVYWARTFGGNFGGVDQFNQVKQTGDGGFVVGGHLQNTSENGSDFALMKLFGDGAFNWAKSFGGVGSDLSNTFGFKADNGFLVGGTTASFGAGGNDIYVLSLNGNGLGCLPDNGFTPTAAANQTLEVGNPTVQYFDVNFYETNNMTLQTAAFNMLQNTQCTE